MSKFLDNTGLTYLMGKLNNMFARIDHEHEVATEEDALQHLIELGVVDPVADENGAVYVADAENEIFVL